ncbi:hypothetical protein HDU93_001744 [Gonapodya sp. JEL0774]|nr:hypothetical protein HDU93_001744 [Gonapodya sp. JEL0774]
MASPDNSKQIIPESTVPTLLPSPADHTESAPLADNAHDVPSPETSSTAGSPKFSEAELDDNMKPGVTKENGGQVVQLFNSEGNDVVVGVPDTRVVPPYALGDITPMAHPDHHYSHRAPWLRAAVLGANDGLVSVAALMLGVAAGGAERHIIFLSGLSSLVAGALSMAVGEYVSVWSQRDAEEADLVRERKEFMRTPAPHFGELDELTQIYISRGLPVDLARRVAEHFHRTYGVEDLVKVHARDELGIDTDDLSNPWQATVMSMFSFAAGGILPLLGGGFIENISAMIGVLVAISMIGLMAFGAIGARLGGAPMWKASIRVLLGGCVALGVTFGIGKAFGVTAG